MCGGQLLPRLTLLAALGACSLTAGACGFIITHGPPEGHEQMQQFSCTESNTGPTMAVISAGLSVLSAAIAFQQPGYYEDPDMVVAQGLASGVVFGAAAGVGFNKVKKCRAAKLELADRQARSQMQANGLDR